MADLWDDDDDDDILELGNRPPMSQVALVVQNKNTSQDSKDVDEILKAKGEVGVLRQKIGMLEKIMREHDENQRKIQHDLKSSHEEEVRKLKIELQRLEDEKKFMIVEQKHLFTPRNSSKSSGSNETDTSIQFPNESKRRKIEPSKEYVSLGQNFKMKDDGSLFFDSLMDFRLPGVQHTVFQCLDHICTYKADLSLSTEIETIKSRSPLGPSIRSLIFKWKSVYSLDQLVDKTLEILAIAIKAICVEEETKYAIPFLIALMHNVISFRHSATSINSLKEIFQFITDFIISDPKFLKQPLHDNPLESDVSPDVFQYAMLDQLCMMYAFDVLETCITILLNCSEEEQLLLLGDDIISENLTKCCSLCLSISYKPILPLIMNVTEILLGVIEMKSHNKKWENRWSSLSSKLLHTWEKPISCNSSKLNFAGLNRCSTSNDNHWMLDKIINDNEVRYLPMIIENDFEALSPSALENQEYWTIQIQVNIAVIMHELAKRYQGILFSVDFLQKSFSLFSYQHSLLLTVFLNRDHINDVKRQQLVTILLKLINFCWFSITDECKKSLRLDELTISLWRIVYGSPASMDDITPEWVSLINPLKNLELEEQKQLLDDAYDEDNLPGFMISEELDLKRDSALSKFTINNSWAFKETAKHILESITTLDEADSLYVAMVGEV